MGSRRSELGNVLVDAAAAGGLLAVRSLIENGLDINAKNNEGFTAIIKAASSGYLEIVRYLVENGANINAMSNVGQNAILLAAWEGHTEVVRYLVENGADIEVKNDWSTTPLIGAAHRGHVNEVHYLVDHGADIHAKDTFGWTPLMVAARRGSLELVRYLVEVGADVQVKDNDGDTTLIWAADHGFPEMVKFLVECGADKDTKNNYGWSALTWAVDRNHLEVVRYLVEQGADTEAKDILPLASSSHLNSDTNRQTRTLSLKSVSSGQYLDGRSPGVAEVSLSSGERNPPTDKFLQWVIGDAGNGYKFIKSVSSGQYLDGRSPGVTEVSLSSGERNPPTDKFLQWVIGDAGKGYKFIKSVSSGQYLDSRGSGKVGLCLSSGDQNPAANMYLQWVIEGNDGRTALMWTACGGHLEIMRCLIEYGADIEAKAMNGWNSLMWAAHRGHLDVIRYLIEQGADIKTMNNNEQTALTSAASGGHLKVVRFLVEQGLEVEAKDIAGETALMSAASVEVMRFLLDQGANPTSLDNYENSVLIRIVSLARNEESVLPIVKLVLERGCSPLHSNIKGKSAKSIAREKGYHGVLDLIKEYASKPRSPARFTNDSFLDVTDWFIKPEKVRYAEKPFTNGGFGKVYRAVWEHNDVVLKEITINTAVEKETFLREVNNWRKARHPNIVPFYGANHLETPCFMISQFATKGTLKDYLYTEKKSNQSTVWRKLLDVAKGLSYLHGQNIVHGDLKGDNIVVGEDRTAMLTDFGLSFVDTRSTRPQQDNLGAMRWRAPEYATQTVHKPSFESDVYSLGMCIVEAVTGDYPWGSLEDAVVTYNLRDGIPLQKPREMNGEQWKLVQGMTVFERTARTSLAKVIEQLVVFAELEEAIELSTRPTDEDQTRQNQQDHSSTSSEYFQSGSSDSARCSDGKIKWSRSL